MSLPIALQRTQLPGQQLNKCCFASPVLTNLFNRIFSNQGEKGELGKHCHLRIQFTNQEKQVKSGQV